MVQGDIDPSIPGTGVPVVAFPENSRGHHHLRRFCFRIIKLARFHQRRILAVIKHPCPTLMCAVRTCGLWWPTRFAPGKRLQNRTTGATLPMALFL